MIKVEDQLKDKHNSAENPIMMSSLASDFSFGKRCSVHEKSKDTSKQENSMILMNPPQKTSSGLSQGYWTKMKLKKGKINRNVFYQLYENAFGSSKIKTKVDKNNLVTKESDKTESSKLRDPDEFQDQSAKEKAKHLMSFNKKDIVKMYQKRRPSIKPLSSDLKEVKSKNASIRAKRERMSNPGLPYLNFDKEKVSSKHIKDDTEIKSSSVDNPVSRSKYFLAKTPILRTKVKKRERGRSPFKPKNSIKSSKRENELSKKAQNNQQKNYSLGQILDFDEMPREPSEFNESSKIGSYLSPPSKALQEITKVADVKLNIYYPSGEWRDNWVVRQDGTIQPIKWLRPQIVSPKRPNALNLQQAGIHSGKVKPVISDWKEKLQMIKNSKRKREYQRKMWEMLNHSNKMAMFSRQRKSKRSRNNQPQSLSEQIMRTYDHREPHHGIPSRGLNAKKKKVTEASKEKKSNSLQLQAQSTSNQSSFVRRRKSTIERKKEILKLYKKTRQEAQTEGKVSAKSSSKIKQIFEAQNLMRVKKIAQKVKKSSSVKKNQLPKKIEKEKVQIEAEPPKKPVQKVEKEADQPKASQRSESLSVEEQRMKQLKDIFMAYKRGRDIWNKNKSVICEYRTRNLSEKRAEDAKEKQIPAMIKRARRVKKKITTNRKPAGERGQEKSFSRLEAWKTGPEELPGFLKF